MSKQPIYDDVPGVNPSVALISPDAGHLHLLRRTMEAQRATIVREFTAYPAYAQVSAVVDVECDAFVVEIDSDLDLAMDLVEAICARKPMATVMVYSSTAQAELMARSMRAGAREYLTGTAPANVIQDALLRAAARRTLQAKKTSGSTSVFWGAKGGCGVTTIAANFAIALRLETNAEVALVDLNPQLGDVAVLLGITPRFTVADGLKNAKRLDQDFVSGLFTSHRSGVSVLAAPDVYDPTLPLENRAVGKLIDVVRNKYAHVVVDAARDMGEAVDAVLQLADTVYLVTQLDVPSLRNAQRMITYLQGVGNARIELVINRHDPRRDEIDDAQVSKALGMAPKWKIPNDYAAARRTANTGIPLIHEKSPASAAVSAMARAASGKPAAPEKRRTFSFFGS